MSNVAFEGQKAFVPMLIQHEKGILFIQPSDNRKVYVTRKNPYKPPTKQDQDKLELLMKNDRHCGIVLEGKQEMPKEQRQQASELAMERARTKELENSLDAMKRELEEAREALSNK